ncbi:uncharacterized protein [Panulirus ornatus]|uniref:uncharacterized protein n=1 Tax=Panulirus ornatus TaxID=150431 RepID=UPI003A8C31C9
MAEHDDINLLVAWTDHHEVLTRIMSTLRHSELFADVTLMCGEKRYAVHKFVLCTCSPYFEKLFESTPCDHPVLVLTETPPEAVEALLDFMYLGKVDVSPDDLDQLLDIAYEFKIRGLISPKDDLERQVVKQATEQKLEAKKSVVEEPSVTDTSESTPSQVIKATEQEKKKVISDVERSSIVDVPKDTISQSAEEKKKKNKQVSRTSVIEQGSFSGTFKRFKKLGLIDAHAESLEAKLLSCPECPYRTKNKATLSKHITKHVKAKPYACPYCSACHSLEQQHITHQKQVHPKMRVIINESATLDVRKSSHKKHKVSDKSSKKGLVSPPSKFRRCSGSRSSPFSGVSVHENIRTSPSPSPTAKVLNSPKSSASSSPLSEVHEFTITSPSPPPELPRSARSNFSSSPPSKVQRVSGMILSSSPPPQLATKTRSSSSSSPPLKRQRATELSLSPSPPPKLPKNTRSSSSSSSPPSKYMKTGRLCISPSPPLESLRSMSASSSSSNISPDYSPSPSPTPPKSLRTTRSSTLADSLRRRSREK